MWGPLLHVRTVTASLEGVYAKCRLFASEVRYALARFVWHSVGWGWGAVLAYLHDVHVMIMMQLLVYLYKGLCNNLRMSWVVECFAVSTSIWVFFTGLVAITVHTTKL